MHPALVDEEQPLGLNRRGHPHPPGSSLELVALRCGSSPFFLLDPIRAMARQIVERLTESPVRACMYSRRSLRVAKGLCLRFASKSLVAFSSNFGADPGLFFGARDSPWSAFFT